jgi:hypothetical protein
MKRPGPSNNRQSLNVELRKSDLEVLHGIVAPEKWGVKNQLKRIALHTFDEGKFLIVENHYFEELKDCLYESVDIRGRVDVDENGFDTIYTVEWRLSSKSSRKLKW